MPTAARRSAPAISCLLAFLVPAGSPIWAQEAPQISSVSPAIVYPYEDIQIYGSGFGKDGSAITLAVDGRTIPLASNPDCSAKKTTTANTAQAPGKTSAETFEAVCATFQLDTTPNQIDLTNLTKEQLKALTGEVRLLVRQDSGIATTGRSVFIKSSQMTWSGVTEASTVVALGISALLLLLVGFGTRQTIDSGIKSGLFSTFLLDPQTCSLSLSKFQFYVWTATAIFGYIYLLLANLFVQQTGQFPDVPSSLPWIFGTSIGTSIGIGAITAVRGPKGAGEIRPRLSDLITAGGVVQPDRVQYLIWTLVGATGYVLTILHLDPRSLTSLPKIPTTLLTLGGVSAAGYVGGRLATKVGPVVDSADVSVAGAVRTGMARAGGLASNAVPGASGAGPAGGVTTPAMALQPTVGAVQQALAASGQTLQSLNVVDTRVTNAVQAIQAAISKSGPIIQALSSTDLSPSVVAGLPRMAQEALAMGKSAAVEISGFAEANLGSANPTSPEIIKSAAQAADQALQQLHLLSSLATQAAPAATNPVSANIVAALTSAATASPDPAASDPNALWVLTLRGRGLSKDATLTFSDPTTPAMEVDLTIPPLIPLRSATQLAPDQLNANNATGNPEIIEQDTDASATDMAKVLRVSFRSATFTAKWQQVRKLNCKITNPDGQAAVFPLDKSQS